MDPATDAGDTSPPRAPHPILQMGRAADGPAARLTRRERQVLMRLCRGESNKEIGFHLGISQSSVSCHLRNALRKLGLRSTAELARLVQSEGGTNELEPEVVARLTPSERQVAAAVMQGLTNAEIARRRGSSPRTVANQLSAIFRKLGVQSRRELRLRIAAGFPATAQDRDIPVPDRDPGAGRS